MGGSRRLGIFDRFKKKPDAMEESELEEQNEGPSEQLDASVLFEDEDPDVIRRKEFNRLFNSDEESTDSDAEQAKKEKGINEYTEDIIEYFTRIQPQQLNAMERGMIPKEQFIEDVKTYIH